MCDAHISISTMSDQGTKIRCRRCDEVIHIEDGSCANCGKKIRSSAALIAGLVLGVVVAAGSLTNPGELGIFGLFGVATAGITGYLLYNKRQRKKQATQAETESSDVLSDDELGL